MTNIFFIRPPYFTDTYDITNYVDQGCPINKFTKWVIIKINDGVETHFEYPNTFEGRASMYKYADELTDLGYENITVSML